MSFAGDLRRFSEKVEKRRKDMVVETGTIVRDSIKEGSPLTGAPGQPVQTGNLKNSWILRFPDNARATVTTDVGYAPRIESGVGLTLRSEVGGFHSVKLTRAAWQKIVDEAARRVVP